MEFDIDNNVDVIQYVLSSQTRNENGDITSEYVPALIEPEFPKRRSRKRQRNEHCWNRYHEIRKESSVKVTKPKNGKEIYPKVFALNTIPIKMATYRLNMTVSQARSVKIFFNHFGQ